MKEWTLASFPFIPWPPVLYAQQDGSVCVCVCGSYVLHGAWVHLFTLCGPHSRMCVMFECTAPRRKLQQLSHQLRKLKEWPANRSEAGLSLWAFPGGIFGIPVEIFRALLVQAGCEWTAMQVWLLVLTQHVSPSTQSILKGLKCAWCKALKCLDFQPCNYM